MRKLIISQHVSLEGFVGGPKGEMDWIKISDEIFDDVAELTNKADTALYSRKTFDMMDAYWPLAGEKPGATKHDKEHSEWYNKVTKYVLSNSLQKEREKIKIINSDIADAVRKLKEQEGKNILIFGSPSAVHILFREGLIDEMYLFVNPILLGKGIPLFKDLDKSAPLKLVSSKVYGSLGVVCLHFST